MLPSSSGLPVEGTASSKSRRLRRAIAAVRIFMGRANRRCTWTTAKAPKAMTEVRSIPATSKIRNDAARMASACALASSWACWAMARIESKGRSHRVVHSALATAGLPELSNRLTMASTLDCASCVCRRARSTRSRTAVDTPGRSRNSSSVCHAKVYTARSPRQLSSCAASRGWLVSTLGRSIEHCRP